jgi:prepilin-type N-terminal cleavage/methylation domain-containing protein/prepilin-type processing-associated H-X9-DG protein
MSNHQFSHRSLSSPKAFSIVELMVVIAIITVLISIALPAIARSRETAERTQCLANMKQGVLVALVYAQENRDRLPFSTNDTTDPTKSHKTWVNLVDQYESSGRLRRCTGRANVGWQMSNPTTFYNVTSEPAPRFFDPNSYLMARNDQWAGNASSQRRLGSLKKNQDKLLAVVDNGGNSRFAGGYPCGEYVRFRHDSGQSINVAMIDGHAENWQRTAVMQARTDAAAGITGPKIHKNLLTDNSNSKYPWGDTAE